MLSATLQYVPPFESGQSWSSVKVAKKGLHGLPERLLPIMRAGALVSELS